MGPRIYLDNAATSWPKPESVYVSVDRYLRECGAAAGRGSYRQSQEASAIVSAARRSAAELIGASSPQQIVFAFNGTDALNLAIHGIVRPGDHVVTTMAEHNSVLRPLRYLEQTQQVRVERVACDERGMVSADAVRAALRPETRLIAATHASNVTGVLQPVAEIVDLAHRHGALVLLDAAQTLGHVPFSLRDIPVDLLAAPGHKGLFGPLGTGLLYVGPQADSLLKPLRQGGTGTQSESDQQPASLPERLESGNLNVAGLAGLAAGLDWIAVRGVATIRGHEQTLTAALLEGLSRIPGITLYGPREASERVGVVSCTAGGYDPQELAALLDASAAIQVRAGLHCAPLVHRQMGTAAAGGTVRFSLGPWNTLVQIESVLDVLRELASGSP